MTRLSKACISLLLINRSTNFGRSIKVRSSKARVRVCFVASFPAIEFQFRCLQSSQGIRTRISNSYDTSFHLYYFGPDIRFLYLINISHNNLRDFLLIFQWLPTSCRKSERSISSHQGTNLHLHGYSSWHINCGVYPLLIHHPNYSDTYRSRDRPLGLTCESGTSLRTTRARYPFSALSSSRFRRKSFNVVRWAERES
jgi:hypothetical protein